MPELLKRVVGDGPLAPPVPSSFSANVTTVQLEFADEGKTISLPLETLPELFKNFYASPWYALRNTGEVGISNKHDDPTPTVPGRVRMQEFGVSFDEFVLALHRLSSGEKPILTVEEERELRNKLRIVALDEVLVSAPPTLGGVLGGTGSSTAEGRHEKFTPIYEFLSFFDGQDYSNFVDLYFKGRVAGIALKGEAPGRLSELKNTYQGLYDLHDESGNSRIKGELIKTLSFPEDVVVLRPQYSSSEVAADDFGRNGYCTFQVAKDKVCKEVLNHFPDSWQEEFLTPFDLNPWDAFGLFVQDILSQRLDFGNGKTGRFALCGGSVFTALASKEMQHRVPCERPAPDYDFFLILDGVHDDPPLSFVQTAANTLHKVLLKYCVKGDKEQDEAADRMFMNNLLGLGAIQRSQCAISIYVSNPGVYGNPVIPIQLVGWYSSLESCLSSFDLGCCQVGYDGNRFYGTAKAVAALATRVNVLNVNDISPTYVSRLGKYFERGIGVAVPCDRRIEGGQVPLDAKVDDQLSGQRLMARRLLQVFESYVQKKLTSASEIVEEYKSPSKRKTAECRLREARKAAYSTYMSQTSIPERVIVMCLQMRQRGFLCFDYEPGSRSLRAVDGMQTRERYPLHQLETSDTVEATSAHQSRTSAYDYPLDIDVDNITVPDHFVLPGRHRGSTRREVERLQRTELRLANQSVDAPTSCGARLLGPDIDGSLYQYLSFNRRLGKEPTTFVTTDLQTALCPVNAHPDSLMPGVFIQVSEDVFPETASLFEDGLMPVPSSLQGPFVMKRRDGGGSFDKRHPKEIFEAGQWGAKSLHGGVDHLTRMVLFGSNNF
ncbi:unnamed protein product [Amoebophrya sp. A120]|nr:unnamed protein product [Amoebophrya sp. A120]|eukprot:GSA120T00024972001.1